MDDKFKRDFIEIFDQQFEQRFITWFNRGFEEVVMPQLEAIREEMTTKTDLNNLEDRFNNRLDRVEIKLDQVVGQVNNHEKRIKNLESTRSVITHTIKK